MNNKYDEDTKAILARREAFVKKTLSNKELNSVKGGELPCFIPLPCLTPQICLSIEPG
jgi:bacteriocin-like protein